MVHPVYRDSLAAWRGLIEIGALEPDDRDEDLAQQLKAQIDPGAPDLDTALIHAPTDLFIQSFFQVIQSFVLMFRDILDFFAKTSEREGQLQWRLTVTNEILDPKHFEEFLERWDNIESLVDVPAIDFQSAWIHHHISEIPTRLLTDNEEIRMIRMNLPDVDGWLTQYENGYYTQFPPSLHPINFGPGIDDMTSVSIAALEVLKMHGITTRKTLYDFLNNCQKVSVDDALHPCIIARNETDYWLRSCVLTIGYLLLNEHDRSTIGEALVDSYRHFPRREISASFQITDLERLLSLPAWRTRHETYGVWVATEIVSSLDGHDVSINHHGGELRFPFRESRIADVTSARPKVSLFSERRTPFDHPIGKGRISSVQPDYRLWMDGSTADRCVAVVEAKHYKRRSRKNFREALIDYAGALFNARVILVNYGPVGTLFDDLPPHVKKQCVMVGNLNPQTKRAREIFRREVRALVGEPLVEVSPEEIINNVEVVAIDVSLSMRTVIDSEWFDSFLRNLDSESTDVVLMDYEVKGIVTAGSFTEWYSKNQMSCHTALRDPVLRVLREHERVIVVTDQEGLESLTKLPARIATCKNESNSEVRLLMVRDL